MVMVVVVAPGSETMIRVMALGFEVLNFGLMNTLSNCVGGEMLTV